jgi:hypothetical protein
MQKEMRKMGRSKECKLPENKAIRLPYKVSYLHPSCRPFCPLHNKELHIN